MDFSSGSRLGGYEILSPLGAGGMGEVYRARDTKLGREVAIKILPDAFAADSDRLARFEREAQLLASLNHPNIAAIYGVEDSTAVKALVLELVEGSTLADRITRGPLPLDEAVAIAKQIADALETAHEHGIIHRDLKPANIKIRPDGVVKVLDFGLAKALDDGSAGLSGDRGGLTASPTLSVHATYAGVILGTAAYMSPEQARGKPVDRRTDVWAFGCVLFEMLSGKQAFESGETVSDAIAAVLTREPDIASLPARVPGAIRTLLRRCLQKDPRKRLPHIGTARLELEEMLAGPLPDATAAPVPPRSRPARPVTVVAAAAASAAIGALAAWAVLRPQPAAHPVLRLQASSATRILINNVTPAVAVSADGSRIVYSGRLGGSSDPTPGRLFVRDLGESAPKALAGATGRNPFFSPDGAWIAYFEQADLKKVAVDGGTPVTICKNCSAGNRGGTWGADDAIIFSAAAGSELRRVPAAGGEVSTLLNRQSGPDGIYMWPEILPPGDALMFTLARGTDVDRWQIVIRDLKTGVQQTVITGAGQAHYVTPGHLVYSAAGTLRAVAFDAERRAVAGTPAPVLDHIQIKPTGAADFSVSREGTLVYVTGDVEQVSQSLTWIDRQGREADAGAPLRNYFVPRISPDGRQVALDVRDGEDDVWIFEVERKLLSRFTFDPGPDQYPIWTPDGQRIVFRSSRSGSPALYWQSSDRTGAAEPFLRDAFAAPRPLSFSPDGTLLAFGVRDPTTEGDIYVRAMDGTARPVLHTAFNELNAEISPDGHWMAYQSAEGGPDQVYVRPFPAVDTGRWQVSTAGGRYPGWAHNGRELFYVDPAQRLMSVAVQTAPGFSSGPPAIVAEDLLIAGEAGRSYDVMPDGSRFLVIKQPRPRESTAEAPEMNVVLNWGEELKRLAPVKR